MSYVSRCMGPASMFGLGSVSLAVLYRVDSQLSQSSAVFMNASLNQTGRLIQPLFVQDNSLVSVVGQETCEQRTCDEQRLNA